MRYHINMLEGFSGVNEGVPNSCVVSVKVKTLQCVVCLKEPS